MERYYFDTYDGENFHRDENGQEVTREELRRQAIASLPEMATDELPDGDYRVFRVKVRDEGGTYVFEASLTYDGGWL